MAGRSLKASHIGIEKAKRALKRRNLTQKALAIEVAIAAWSTINKFFTGKPVSRSIFLEICEYLDLDWNEIAENTAGPEPDSTTQNEDDWEGQDLIASAIEAAEDLDAAVQTRSQRARMALEPYILQRIPRPALLQKCRGAIARGLREQKRRVVPILGAAGYGKSTFLGNLYDDLLQVPRSEEETLTADPPKSQEASPGWVILIRCNDLIESADTLALELGETASGRRESIVEIAAQLTARRGKGILLLDTLDLVLTKPLVPVFRGVVLDLLAIETTVVFTCRDRDYCDFFEPYHESFAGFVNHLERCDVPEFDEAEVRAAAQAFAQRELGVAASENAQDFAHKIVTLCADRKSLQEITHNPLLLALLCKLFAEEGSIPEDLTVGQLYDIYWDFRIAQSRKNRPDSRRIATLKRHLCLELAGTLYKKSSDRLRDFVYESNLDLDEREFFAYEELKSDGVLQELGRNRIGFFHQTFLEYAIARWLDTTEAGEKAKTQLLETISRPNSSSIKHFIWPALRQLLNLTDIEEFEQIAQRLNTREILPFRALAFASVSRLEPRATEVWQPLLNEALALGEAYQATLLSAARGSPNRHVATVWWVVVELLEKTGSSLVNLAAETTGELLARLPTSQGEAVKRAFLAAERRKASRGDEDSALALGQLASAYAKVPKTFGRGMDSEVLAIFQSSYFKLGSRARSYIIQLYLTPGVPETLQQNFFLTLIQKPVTEQFKEKEPATELCKRLLPHDFATSNSPLGTTELDALSAPLAKGWDIVQATAIGQHAAVKPPLIDLLVNRLFQDNLSPSDGILMRRHQIAIAEAIKRGAGNWVARALLTVDNTALPANRVSTVTTLIRELSAPTSPPITSENRELLARWLQPLAERYPTQLIPVIDILAHQNSSVRQLLGQLLENLLPQLQQQQVNQILKKLNRIPEQLLPYLQTTVSSKESRLALIKYYRNQITEAEDESALVQLLNFCLDESREVALAASRFLLDLAQQGQRIGVSAFLPILQQSPILGVRQNCLKALIEQVKIEGSTTDTELVNLCQTLERDSAPEVIQPLYKSIECWVQLQNSISPDLARAAFDLTERLFVTERSENLDSGIVQAAFILLKNLANLENPVLSDRLKHYTRILLRTTDINRAVNHLFVIGLLERLARSDRDFLSTIVQEDFITAEGNMALANMGAVVVAIAYTQGKYSALLDNILYAPRFPQELKNRIIREREG
jgi:transcriptional regulator with XRE-family HTH domain